MRKLRFLLFVILFVTLSLAVGQSFSQTDDYDEAAELLATFDFDECVAETADDSICDRLQAAANAYAEYVECDTAETPELPANISIPSSDGTGFLERPASWQATGCYSAAMVYNNSFFTMAYLDQGEWVEAGGGGTFATGLGNSMFIGLYEATVAEIDVAVMVLEAGPSALPYAMVMWKNPLVSNDVRFNHGLVQNVGPHVSTATDGIDIEVTGESGVAVLIYNTETDIFSWETE